MAENTTIRDSFFDSLTKGAKWDVGVSINRTNPLPLDQYSVFKTETELDNYIKGAFSYPGQIVALVGESETVIYYLAEKADHTSLEKIEVGSMPEVDNKTIEIKTDKNGNEYLTLVGFGDKYIGADEEEHEFEEGLQLTTVSTEDGFKLAWIKPDTTTVEGLSTAVGALGGRMTTAERDIDALEAKFANMGGIFNFAGAFTSAQFANEKAENYDIGDVVLVDSKDEYLCVEAGRNTVENYVLSQDTEPVAGKEYYTKDGEDNYTVVTEPLNPTEFQYYEKTITVVIEKRWEQFGDPEGVNILKEEIYGTGEGEEHVNGIKENLSDLTGQVGVLKTAVGKADDNSGLYGYATEVATTKAASALTDAKAYTDEKVEPVATQVNTNKQAITDLNTSLETKASKTYVDTQLSTKVDKTEYQDRVNELEKKVSAKAENSYVNEELAKKANASDVTTATQSLGNRLTLAEQDIDTLELAIGQKDAEGKYPATSLTGRVESIVATDIAQNKDIVALKAGLGTFGDNKETTADGEVYKKTAFAQAAEAKALANDAASLAATKADKTATENALNLKANAADVSKTIGSIPKGEGDKEQSVVEYIDSSITTASNALTTEINKKADDGEVKTALETKANKTDVAAKIGEIGDVSVKTYVDNIADTKVDKETYNADKLEINNKIDLKANQADVTSAIGAINAKIGTLGNVMNFVGELEGTKDKGGNVTITGIKNNPSGQEPEHGDVGYFEAFEYVYIVTTTGEGDEAVTTKEWAKFGDTSAEGGRISTLEEKVGYETTYKEDENGDLIIDEETGKPVVDKEGKGLVKDVADLKAAEVIINNEINDIKTQTALLATKAELKAEEDARKEADNTEAAARAAADEAEAKARKDADDAEAAARAQADADLRTYIDTVLEWGSF